MAASCDGEGNPLACACGMRGPKPYGERDDVFFVVRATFFFVARGPVPRDRWLPASCFSVAIGMARDRPSPYVRNGRADDGEGQALALRHHPYRSGSSEALAHLPSDPDPFEIGRSRTTEVGVEQFMKHPQNN